MGTIHLLRRLMPGLAVLLCCAHTSWPQSADHGIVKGRVVDASTGEPLIGANVMIRGTRLGDATDGRGHFVMVSVPPGVYEVEVSYIGYQKSVKSDVNVKPRESTSLEFSLQPGEITFGEMVVWGPRALGQARALNQQMNAPNIKNVVASDLMGRFPDASAPEAVQRIPGIAVQRDQGEGRYIQIRGGAAQMTSVTFNGERVPTPEGSIRQIALDAVPADIIESIEVSKAITPDMDADAIGGSVDLHTKKAPEEALFSVEAAGGYASIRDRFGGSGALTYGNRARNGALGYLFSASWSRRNFGSDDLEPVWTVNNPGLADDQLNELQVRHYTLWRERQGATAMVDYRWRENSTLYLSGIYSELKDNEQRRRLRHRVGRGTVQPDGSVTGAELLYQHKNRFEVLQTYNLTAGGDHLLPGGIKLDYHVTAARSQEDTPKDTEVYFLQKKVTFRPTFSDANNIQANPQANAVDGTYLFSRLEPASSITRDRDLVAAVNLAFPFHSGRQSVGKIKIGGKFRDKNKIQDVTEESYKLQSGAANIILGQGLGVPFSNDGYNPGNYPLPPYATTEQEVADFLSRYQTSLSGGHVREDEVNDYEVSERTAALYGAAEIDFASFMLLAGVRFERTSLSADGFEFDPDTETLTPTKGESAYNKFFPMLHARYTIAPRTNLRAAITTALARPNFLDLAPYRIRADENFTIGNPDLKPTTSVNLDLLFEHYDELIGVISAGLFYKRITDPIFLFTETNSLGGQTSQPRNGTAGDIRGVEVAVQRQLKFLPSPLDGLGFYGNYTYTTSEAKLPGGRKTPFPGQADHVFNVAVSYEKGGFSGQISLNNHNAFIDEFGGDVGSKFEREVDVFVDKHLQLDFSATFQVINRIGILLELVNLTNAPFRMYQGTTLRPRQSEFYETWGRLGVRYRM